MMKNIIFQIIPELYDSENLTKKSDYNLMCVARSGR